MEIDVGVSKSVLIMIFCNLLFCCMHMGIRVWHQLGWPSRQGGSTSNETKISAQIRNFTQGNEVPQNT